MSIDIYTLYSMRFCTSQKSNDPFLLSFSDSLSALQDQNRISVNGLSSLRRPLVISHNNQKIQIRRRERETKDSQRNDWIWIPHTAWTPMSLFFSP
jgi:hypothetical protein